MLMYFAGFQIGTSIKIPIAGIQNKIDTYVQLTEMGISDFDKINLLSLVYLARMAIYYFILLYIDLIKEKNKYTILLVNIYMLSLIAFPLFSAIPVLAYRVTELYGIVEIILFPLLFYVVKQKVYSRVLVGVIATALILTSLLYSELIT